MKKTIMDFIDNECTNNFHSNLSDLRMLSEFTDVVLKCENSEIQCHRIVLSAASKYFHAMFTSGMEETLTHIVEIKNIDGETLQMIVDYMYTTKVTITEKNVQNLIQASDLFHFDGLKMACEKFLEKQVAPSNCIGFYKFAKLFSLKHLQEVSRLMMLSQFKDVVKSAEFSLLNASELVEYISDDNLHVTDEDPVFGAVMIWISAAWLRFRTNNSLHQGTPKSLTPTVSEENEKCINVSPLLYEESTGSGNSTNYGKGCSDKELDSIFSHVRFPYCSSTYLCHAFKQLHQNVDEKKTDSSSNGGLANDVILTAANLPAATARYLEEARQFHLLPNHRHEICTNRTRPRKSFNVQRRLVVVGGLMDDDRENRYCWYLSEDSDTWELLAMLPRPNWKFYSVCALQQGILITGGYHSNVKKDCWLFDTSEKKWKSLAPMNEARCKHRAIVHSHFVYVLGGEDDIDRPLASVERFDPRMRLWEYRPGMKKPLSDPRAVSYGQHIYVFGGIEEDDATSTWTQAYDTVWNEWSVKREMPSPCRLGAVALVNERIYVIGGYTRTCMAYEPLLDEWTILLSPREKHGNAPAVVWKGKILVGGGDVDSDQTTSVVEEYDPVTNEWSFWYMNLKEELSCHYLLNVDLFGI